jgi:hypothetical protein
MCPFRLTIRMEAEEVYGQRGFEVMGGLAPTSLGCASALCVILVRFPSEGPGDVHFPILLSELVSECLEPGVGVLKKLLALRANRDVGVLRAGGPLYLRAF